MAQPVVKETTDHAMEFDGEYFLSLLRKEGYEVPHEKDVTITRIAMLKKRGVPEPQPKYKFTVRWVKKIQAGPYKKVFDLGQDK